MNWPDTASHQPDWETNGFLDGETNELETSGEPKSRTPLKKELGTPTVNCLGRNASPDPVSFKQIFICNGGRINASSYLCTFEPFWTI